jgi:PIN domain nuclease of toxin-antitoxin system
MTRYLLDTPVFLWNFAEPEILGNAVRRLFDNPADGVFLSAASAWEISIKFASGKLRLPEPPRVYVSKRTAPAGLLPLHITSEHALRAGDLPKHHSDPFDRMLIAQAQSEGLILVTPDRLIAKYSVETLWAGN